MCSFKGAAGIHNGWWHVWTCSRYVDHIRVAEGRICQTRQVRMLDSFISLSFRTDVKTVSDLVMNISSSPLTMYQRPELRREENPNTKDSWRNLQGRRQHKRRCKTEDPLPCGLSPNLSPQDRKAIKELKDKKDIIILLAINGKKTVVMDTTA